MKRPPTSPASARRGARWGAPASEMATSVRSSAPVGLSVWAAGRAVSARGAAGAKGAPAWQQVRHVLFQFSGPLFIVNTSSYNE